MTSSEGEPEMNGGRTDLKQDAFEGCPEPQPGETLMRVVSLRDSNLIEVEDSDQQKALCTLPPKFGQSTCIKIGNFVLVEEGDSETTAAAGNKATGTVVKLLSDEHVSTLRKSAFWPSSFLDSSEKAVGGTESPAPVGDPKATIEQNGDDKEIHEDESTGWNGSNGIQKSSSHWTDAGTNPGWEIAENQSVLGPGPTDEEKAADYKPTPAKELHTYFMIRIPKPADNKGKTEIRKAELRFKEKAEKRDFINAAIQMKRASRNEALHKLKAAREKVRACGDATRQKREEIEPLQGALRKLRDTGRMARDKSRDLPASEQELDDRIAYYEYRIQHESIPLKEEKQLLRDIKNLRACREEVCANEALHAEFSESLGEREDIQDRLKPLISELESSKAEWTIATEKTKAAEVEFEKMDAALNQVQEQWAAANRARQDAYDERTLLIRQENARNDEFYQNRREIQHVRQLAFKKEKGAVEELCNAQVERVMKLWNNNAEFRAAYVKSNERSTLKRLQTFDGRALGPNEEPPLISSDSDDVPVDTQMEVGPSIASVHSQRGGPAEPNHIPVNSTSEVQRKDHDRDSPRFSESNGHLSSSKAAADLDAISSAQEEQGKEDLQAAAKLKEKRREQEMAKAKEAEERKRRSAERLQSKALARAQKEAERREKEKEKKAQKKAATLLSSSQGVGPAVEAGRGGMHEAEPDSNPVQEVPRESKPSGRQRKRPPSQKLKTMKTPLASSLSKKDGMYLSTWRWIVAGLIGVLVILAFFARFVI